MQGPQSSDTAELWDQRYRQPNHYYGYRPNDFLVEAELMLPRHSRVLVLGDGEGRNGVWLARQGHQVVSVDLSPVGVEKARTLAREQQVSIDAQVGDLTWWLDSEAAQGPWDGVVWIFLHPAPELRRRIAETLTPRISARGKLIVEAFSTAQLGLDTGGPREESRLFTRQRLHDDWPGLWLETRIVERRIFEGMAHQGLGAVIQALGQPLTTTSDA